MDGGDLGDYEGVSRRRCIVCRTDAMDLDSGSSSTTVKYSSSLPLHVVRQAAVVYQLVRQCQLHTTDAPIAARGQNEKLLDDILLLFRVTETNPKRGWWHRNVTQYLPCPGRRSNPFNSTYGACLARRLRVQYCRCGHAVAVNGQWARQWTRSWTPQEGSG